MAVLLPPALSPSTLVQTTSQGPPEKTNPFHLPPIPRKQNKQTNLLPLCGGAAPHSCCPARKQVRLPPPSTTRPHPTRLHPATPLPGTHAPTLRARTQNMIRLPPLSLTPDLNPFSLLPSSTVSVCRSRVFFSCPPYTGPLRALFFGGRLLLGPPFSLFSVLALGNGPCVPFLPFSYPPPLSNEISSLFRLDRVVERAYTNPKTTNTPTHSSMLPHLLRHSSSSSGLCRNTKPSLIAPPSLLCLLLRTSAPNTLLSCRCFVLFTPSPACASDSASASAPPFAIEFSTADRASPPPTTSSLRRQCRLPRAQSVCVCVDRRRRYRGSVNLATYRSPGGSPSRQAAHGTSLLLWRHRPRNLDAAVHLHRPRARAPSAPPRFAVLQSNMHPCNLVGGITISLRP